MTVEEKIADLTTMAQALERKATNETAAYGFATPVAELDMKQARRYREEALRLGELLD